MQRTIRILLCQTAVMVKQSVLFIPPFHQYYITNFDHRKSLKEDLS